jgi:hypothetical protein
LQNDEPKKAGTTGTGQKIPEFVPRDRQGQMHFVPRDRTKKHRLCPQGQLPYYYIIGTRVSKPLVPQIIILRKPAVPERKTGGKKNEKISGRNEV